MTRTMILAALAGTTIALSGCGLGQAGARRIQEGEQKLYDLEVQAYGRQAVLECRSRMSPYSPRMTYCLEAYQGAVK